MGPGWGRWRWHWLPAFVVELSLERRRLFVGERGMTGRRDNNDSKSVGQRREEEEQCANKRNSNEGDEPIYMGGKQALKVRVTSDPRSK